MFSLAPDFTTVGIIEVISNPLPPLETATILLNVLVPSVSNILNL
jgi:hypothetical protein